MDLRAMHRVIPQYGIDAAGPCVGCGERNHTAHHVSICADCRVRLRDPENCVVDGCDNDGAARVCCEHTDRLQGAGTRGDGDSLTPRKSDGTCCQVVDCSRLAKYCGAHGSEGRKAADAQGRVQVAFTHFEAAMVLCVLAVAKEGKSQFDAESVPLRRTALANAYGKVSAALGVEEP